MERRLFPFKRPTNRLPTVDEILPTTSPNIHQESSAESKIKIRHLDFDLIDESTEDGIDDDDRSISDDNIQQVIDPNDPESLQSVESNHVDSYYPDMNESTYIYFLYFRCLNRFSISNTLSRVDESI